MQERRVELRDDERVPRSAANGPCPARSYPPLGSSLRSRRRPSRGTLSPDLAPSSSGDMSRSPGFAEQTGLRDDGRRLMTDAAAPPATAPGRPRPAARWLRTKDPDLLVIKRSVRAAIVMPSAFAIAHVCFSDPQVSLFAAFGSFAAPPPGRIHRPGAHPPRLLPRPLPRRELLHRARDGGLHAQGRRGGDDGPGRLRRALRRNRSAAGGHGLDGRPVDLRAPRRGGATDLGDRPAPRWGCRWRPRAASPPASSSGRRPGTTTSGAASRPPSRPWGAWPTPAPGARPIPARTPTSRRSWRSCASSSRARRTHRPAPPPVPSRSPSSSGASSGSRGTRPCSVTSTGRPNGGPPRPSPRRWPRHCTRRRP